MPRSLVLGNGSLLATFDEFLQLRDFYYPYVGEEDHTTYGKFHRVGFFIEEKGFSWTNDGSWKIRANYMESSLVSESTMINEKLGLEIISEDFVDPTRNMLIRSFRIRSTDGKEHTLKCFFNHDFYLYGDKQKDTAFYEPHTKTVIHYRQNRYFLVGGTTSDPLNCKTSDPPDAFHPFFKKDEHIDHCGIVGFSIGKSNYRGLEGTWRDAEDGQLSGFPIEQGSVDSTVQIDCLIHPDRETTVNLWVCAGKHISEVHDLQHAILQDTPDQIKKSAKNYWRGWSHSHRDPGPALAENLRDLYWRSLLTIRTQIDNNGGVIAAADSDIMQFNRDTYTYVWPRDGAFVSLALTNAGQSEVVARFLDFCARVQTHEGYLLHKYNPDGSPGSSWHPWYANGHSLLPIQGDETALPLVALWRHFEKFQDFEFLHTMFQNFVKKAADFLIDYREEETGLPLASYDLWEEHRGISTFTTAATCAGLRAAGSIATALGHHRHAEKYNEAFVKMQEAMITHLFDEETQCFMKKIQRKDGQTTERDTTPDASISTIWMFGILSPSDPRVVSTIKRLKDKLTVRTGIGGIARYTNDYYQTVTPPTADVPGNPWIITTLWFAQWQIATAKKIEDLEEPHAALQWAHRMATVSGILPEQMHPFTGAPLSVAPLTWSHAVYVDTVLRYSQKLAEMTQGGKGETQVLW
ncbi:MAG: glycoside hydrolase family 15 protein [Candidatus Peribacteraceae bacterium]|nr:glycoside hydrolase family 15 protein [Candidatus Peribacteraceae bacterium]